MVNIDLKALFNKSVKHPYNYHYEILGPINDFMIRFVTIDVVAAGADTVAEPAEWRMHFAKWDGQARIEDAALCRALSNWSI